MAEEALYFGGSHYGLFAYGTTAGIEAEGYVSIRGKATLTVDGYVTREGGQVSIVGRADVLARGVRETFGEVSIVGKATLTSTISYVGVIATLEVIHRNEEVVVQSYGRRADVSITDIKDDRIKPVVAVSQAKPKVSVITRTSKVEPLHRGAEITYQIERSEEHIYAD